MKNKLIYDILITGHHSEYISHLVNYIVNGKLEEQYYFVVAESFKSKFHEIIKSSEKSSSIVWEFVPEDRVKKIINLSLIKRSFAELKLVKEYANKNAVKHVYLLYFNTLQLALIFKRTSFYITGILFLQFLRAPRNNWVNKLKYYRKYFTTKLYVYNSKIKRVFILNDDITSNQLNSEFNTTIFKALPDPIPVCQEEIDFNIYNYYNISENKKILLHSGSIDPRKGTYEIIESIDCLGKQETSSYALLIVGKAKSNIEEVILYKIKELKNKNFTIVFDNSFVSNERLKSIFLQSYAVLMPYKNSEASSGILGHAIIANKPVLSPNLGLVGELIEENKFGILIDKIDDESIAKGIRLLESFKIDIEKANSFVYNHTIGKFSKTFLIDKFVW